MLQIRWFGTSASASEEQKAVLKSMQTLHEAVEAYRPGIVANSYPAGVAVENSGISGLTVGAAGTFVDYKADNVDYGVIFYHDKVSATTLTLDEILAADGTVVYSKSNGTASLYTGYINAIYDKGIYTNELDTNLYCVPFVVVDGEIFYCPVITWNLLTEMETFAANNELSAEEIAVFEAMLALHDDTMAYRATVD